MWIRSFIVALVAILCGVLPAGAQVNTATVNGIINDESKAVLPGATVTATDLETGRKYVAVSDDRRSARCCCKNARSSCRWVRGRGSLAGATMKLRPV